MIHDTPLKTTILRFKNYEIRHYNHKYKIQKKSRMRLNASYSIKNRFYQYLLGGLHLL